MKNKKNNLLKILIIVIVIVFAFNIGIIISSKKAVKEKVATTLETSRPANIRITVIKDSSCTNCADLKPFLDAVKKTNSKIIDEKVIDVNNGKSKNVISEFKIKKLPTFIIKGEINKNEDLVKLLSKIGETKDSVFKFNYFIAPYLDLASNSVKGKVTVTFINDKSCADCYNLSPFKQILANNLGMYNSSKVYLDRTDKSARALIRKYKIESVPTIVLSGDVSEYKKLTGAWLQVGTLEKDGSYILRDIKKLNPSLIYRDLKTGKIIKPEKK